MRKKGLLCLVLAICFIFTGCTSKEEIKQRKIEETTNILEEYELSDYKVEISYKGEISDYDFYNIDVTLADKTLDDETLYQLLRELQSITESERKKYFYTSGGIYIDGEHYEIDPTDYEIITKDFREYYNHAALNKNGLSFEVQVYKWIKRRYDYYDEKDGGYAGDKYTETIFDEAASEFGISRDKVNDIWFDTNVANIANN